MKPKLAFVSLWDAADPGAESGYAYSMRRQLQKRFDIVDVFPLEMKGAAAWLPLRIACRTAGRYYHPMREPSILKSMALRIEDVLNTVKPDVVFSPSSVPMSFVTTRCPWMYATDQLFHDFLGAYVERPSRRFQRLGEAQERSAIKSAARVSYPSRWAADTAIGHYQANVDKVSVIPWGANLPKEFSEAEIAAAIQKRNFETCRLVFIGRDWQRKGGDLFVETVQALNTHGVPAHGTIIGTNPTTLPTGLFTVYPNLDKSRPEHFSIFVDALIGAHFLMAPSRAEAYGQALCEAMSFGVPAAASAIGGIPTIVTDRETGILLPAGARADEYASRIAESFSQPAVYRRMAAAAREDYRTRLNWDRFGVHLGDTLMSLV